MRVIGYQIALGALVMTLSACDSKSSYSTSQESYGPIAEAMTWFNAKSAAADEEHDDDEKGACMDLCPELHACLEGACYMTIPAWSCEHFCADGASLNRPACDKIKAAAAEPNSRLCEYLKADDGDGGCQCTCPGDELDAGAEGDGDVGAEGDAAAEPEADAATQPEEDAAAPRPDAAVIEPDAAAEPDAAPEVDAGA